MLMDAFQCFLDFFSLTTCDVSHFLSPLFYPGEMSLGPTSSVKLASLTERLAKRPCSDWRGIPWLCHVGLLPSLLLSPLLFSLLSSGKISTLPNTSNHIFSISFSLIPWSLSFAATSQRSLCVDSFMSVCVCVCVVE